MAKSEQCTEFQVIIHVILIFGIGALIGTSLVSKTDNMEVKLSEDSINVNAKFKSLIEQYNARMEAFDNDYNLVKEHGLSAYEINCLTLTNYFMDNSDGNELQIEFNDSFIKTPRVFLSINGLKYGPTTARGVDEVESVSFPVVEPNEKGFKIALESSSGNFNKDDFNGLDICYFAFIQYDEKQFKN